MWFEREGLKSLAEVDSGLRRSVLARVDPHPSGELPLSHPFVTPAVLSSTPSKRIIGQNIQLRAFVLLD
jgi:hypothetical protein